MGSLFWHRRGNGPLTLSPSARAVSDATPSSIAFGRYAFPRHQGRLPAPQRFAMTRLRLDPQAHLGPMGGQSM
eukprot:8265124-Pyramimonas_sp.AAC.1